MKPNDTILSEIMALRHTLHEIPELSGQETKTMETLKTFLRTHTTCSIHEHNGWFYARRDIAPDLPTIAFRADTDAIVCAADGQPYHGCGHDGHAAALAGLAYLTESADSKPNCNLLFLFQPAEETGEGAKLCCSIFERESVSAICGCHTIPGFPHGTVLLRDDVFACASRGMVLRFTGRQSHAAYPETGCNPASVIAALTTELDTLTQKTEANGHGMVLTTVVGMQVGGRNFGVSPGEGTLCLTVRAHYESDLEQLTAAITERANTLCCSHGITLDTSYLDVFPDTVNDPTLVSLLRQKLDAASIPHMTLAEPMRWSEDFGHYCRHVPGLFFGIGTGEHAPALHTDGFAFDDTLLPRILEVWLSVIDL